MDLRGRGGKRAMAPRQTPEVALCPVGLVLQLQVMQSRSNIELIMAPRMHQNMQLGTQKLKKILARGPLPRLLPQW